MILLLEGENMILLLEGESMILLLKVESMILLLEGENDIFPQLRFCSFRCAKTDNFLLEPLFS